MELKRNHLILGGVVLAAVVLLATGLFMSVNPRADLGGVSSLGALNSEADVAGKVFNAQEMVLDNGMRVVVIPNNRAPVVTHMVWYKVGAAEEPMGKSGIAHFLEHLMFKGSPIIGRDTVLEPGQFSRIIRGIGGRDNAFTSQDYTAYFQSIPADQLALVMRMEAGRMRGLNPPLEEVDSERLVILEERRQRTDNDPRGRFREQLTANAFINHPYGTPVIGWYHEMEVLDWDMVKAFYDIYYAPNNAILVVSGNVTAEDVYALAEETYGTIPASLDLPERVRTRSPIMNSSTTVTLTDATIREPVFQVLYRVPSVRQDGDVSLALQVLEEVMGGGSTSRLYKSLVVEQKIAVNAGLSYQAYAFDDARLWLYATPAPGYGVDEVRAALEVELRALIADGITDAELSDAKTRMQDAAIYARDSLNGPAMVIGQALSTGVSLDAVEYWPSNIAGVTAEQVQDAARTLLNPDAPIDTPPVIGVLLPETLPESAPESAVVVEETATDKGEEPEVVE